MAVSWTGSTANDFIDLTYWGQPPSGGNIYNIDGKAGNDTFSLQSGSLTYDKRFDYKGGAGFTIAPADVNQVIVVSGASTKGGGVFTFNLTSIETLVIWDSTINNYRTITLNYGPVADTTPPVFSSASVNGSTLVMTYTDTNNLDAAYPPLFTAFNVSNHAVTGVTVDGVAKTVTLTLGSAVAYGEAVTVSYTDPSSGNDVSAIQDLAGNDAATLAATAVTNNTPAPADTTAPVFVSAGVNGTTLVMTYSDTNNLDATHPPLSTAFNVSNHAVTGVAVDGVAKTVTLTLGTAVVYGEAVTVSYTDPTTGNDVSAIQDLAGNDAATLIGRSVTNNTPVPDTTPPTLDSASVNGTTLVMTFLDANNLDAAHPPLASAFSVTGHTVNTVAVDASAHTVTLTLNTSVTQNEVVTVHYTDPTVNNDVSAIQDVAGNDAASFTTQVGPDTQAPTVVSFSPLDNATGIAVNSDIVLAFSEPVTGTIEIKTAAGTLVPAVLTGSGTTTLTVNPTTDLTNSTHYIVTTHVVDGAGNSYVEATPYDFTTADPYVASSGGGGGAGVAVAGVGGLALLAWVLF
ncbi:MAG: hypothetical protein FDX21_01535 [Chlorobium sp.]|nr:MAG: hypothetical protein FDX21_01535 [Chlorobium sp.]